MSMLGLTTSELGIVLFLLSIVVLAGRLPRWGEAFGSFLYKRSREASGETSERAADSLTDESKAAGKSSRKSIRPADT